MSELAGVHVLVVEDNHDVLALICDLLDDLGCRVTGAHSGEDGLELAFADPPDVALIDLILPQMNGHDVVRALRADERTSGCYLIVASVLDAQDRAVSGADSTLGKPFRRGTLADAIRPALDRRPRADTT